MKKLTIVVMALFMLFLGVQAQASVIDDSTFGMNTYWGAVLTPPGSPQGNKDIYGGVHYALDKMVVTTGGGNMTVQVIGSYFSAWTAGNTSGMAPGDLFIDLQGWNPVGTGPHYSDDSALSHGAVWDLAFDLQTMALYSTANGNITMSNNLIGGSPVGTPYRSHQEWDFVATGAAIATGGWSIVGDTLTMTFPYIGSAAGLGMHWTMQCGNDVINGGVPVPEPSMMVLFGAGLIGLGFFARKKA